VADDCRVKALAVGEIPERVIASDRKAVLLSVKGIDEDER